ncbi:hypothetical protein [Streptomyces brasiliensis]|uniref:Uncharacterized protein n=1 Tax=Streptomyces brasiliensis TaxID=1954 RepID=A0A917NK61_9ACTN|nr:hypothetical protein [Streptomyces brasiliensis]GGJ03872.1 hypothetical protein GCM10010121_012740 [Streptomyces brasiliensis]
MSEPAHEAADVPQPPMQVEAIRSALAQVAPELLPRFDEARVAATAKARLSVSATPLRNFVQGWAVEVAIARRPETSARLRDLEARAARAASLDEARAIAAEISSIRRSAAVEVGLHEAGAR